MKYSIVIYSADLENFKKTIESIIKQSYNLENVEIIVENIYQDKEIKKYVDDLTDINIIYNEQNIKDLATCYNHALNIATGEYITFINSDIVYDNIDTLLVVANYLEKYNVVAINGGYFDLDKNARERYKMQPKKNSKINLYTTPYKLQMLFETYFFKTEKIKKYSFKSNLYDECKVKFLFNVLNETFVYYYLNKITLTSSEPFENNTSKCAIQYQSWWYINSLKNLIIPELYQYENVPEYIEEACMYLIFAKFNCNTKDRNKNVLTNKDFEKFRKLVVKALIKIHDSKIIQTSFSTSTGKGKPHQVKIPRWLRFWFLNQKIDFLKAKKEIKLIKIGEQNNILLEYKLPDKTSTKEYVSTDKNYKSSEKIKIQAINYVNGEIYIDAETSISDFVSLDDIKIIAKLDDDKINVTATKIYSTLKAFGVDLTNGYTFKLKFKVDLNKKQELKFYTVIDGEEIPLNISYDKVQARLSKSKRSFWCYKDIILLNNQSSIVIEKKSLLKELKYEMFYDLSKLKNEKDKKRTLKLVGLRVIYYLTRPFYKNKHVWITFDKLYKAGDNGEYIYQYGLKHNKNIYYIIKKDSPDYKRLVKQNRKHILVFNSLKAKLLSLHAEAILKTHANLISYCGFDGLAREMVSGLFNAEVIEIQHGLTIQEIAQYQNRLFDNIKLYCCASKNEVNNLLQPEYDFEKRNIILTGLARYDGLKSNDQKIILITPTWRRNIVNSNIVHIKKSHNNNFINSEYYKIYDSLINNKKLIDKAKKTGYKIIYLLHPAVSSQINDFDKNDYVKIVPAAGDMSYEKILTESSLMVTDYSGVQFDFAYQRKPILYYHPDVLPPHYKTGVYDYKTMAFGSICKNENDLVNELCEYIDNNCQIKEEYKNRADNFFAFSDYDNCKRIISAVDDYLKKVGGRYE